jgi:hypothetical protein
MSSTRADVEQLLERHVSFVRIEEYIDGRRDISEDDRDGLSLYAWSRSRTPGSGRGAVRAISARLDEANNGPRMGDIPTLP